MKFFKKIPKITLALLTTLIILLIVTVGFLIRNEASAVAIFSPKNEVTITAAGNQIVLQSQIDPKEVGLAEQFLETVGLNIHQVQKMSFNFDQNTVDTFGKLLPIKLELTFVSPKALQFSGNTNGDIVFESMLSGNYKMATGSAMISYQNGSLRVVDPQAALNYATSAGQLNLSHKLDPAVTNLGKVSTIEVHVQNNKINGMILLK